MYAEHFQPLFEQIQKLEEAIFNIQFEQHWLEAETDRQAICNCFLTFSNFDSFVSVHGCLLLQLLYLQIYNFDIAHTKLVLSCFICVKCLNLETYAHITVLQ